MLTGTVYTVNSLQDTVADDGKLTLREAIQAANTNTAVNEAPAGSATDTDQVEFDVAALQAEAGADIPLKIVLDGTELQITEDVEIVGPGADVLTIDAAGKSRVVENSAATLTLTGVTLTGGNVFYSYSDGGGILANGTTTLMDVTISGNTAYNGGGGICASGTTTLTNVTISGNTANNCGGGIYAYGPTTLTNVTISRNTAYNGGGMFAMGTTTLTNVTISENTGGEDGGGILTEGDITTLTSVTISRNTVTGDGGGIYAAGATTTLTNVTISGNTVSLGGSTNGGGGIYAAGATTTLTNVTISGNAVSSAAASGGGIYASGTTTALTNVTISGNTAGGSGGGIYTEGGVTTLTNVTISRNSAFSSSSSWASRGGGLCLDSGALTLRNTIIAQNAASEGTDIYCASGAALDGASNLIGDGTGQTEVIDDVDGNLVGTSASPIDPKLAEGSTFGIGLSPLPGSPAIDAGDDSLIPAEIATDAYGQARIQGAHVNIGAVEAVLPPKSGVTYVVMSLADTVAADGVLTLREALAAANSNQAVGDAPAGSYSWFDRIEFAPGLTGTILTNGQAYQITGSLALAGPGATLMTVDAQGSGGVLDIRGPYAVTVGGLTLTDGKTSYGGGIFAAGAHLALDLLAISGNTADYDGGGIYACDCTMTLRYVMVSRNTASTGDGGGIYASDGPVTLTNVIISGNMASCHYNGGDGGGIYASDGPVTFTNVTISGNTAGDSGGGIYTDGGTTTLTNVTISGNTADLGDGGGIHADGGTVTLNNSIITLNHAAPGPDISGDWSGTADLVGTYPGFVHNPSPGSDDIWGTADDDYGDLRLKLGSPAINAGDSTLIPPGITTDVMGNPRIADGVVDMGAYEGTVVPTYTRATFGLVNGKTVTSSPLQDQDGDTVTFKLTGGGTGTVYGLGTAFEDIILAGTTAKSVLTITVKKSTIGDGLVDIGNIRGDSPVKAISANKCDIVGSGIYFDGNYVGSINVRDLQNGADITIGGDSSQSSSITVAVVEDGSDITSGEKLSKLTAINVGAGSITAPSIASFSVTANKSRDMTGDLAANILLTGPANSTVLAKLSVRGSFYGATIRANTGNLGTLTLGAVDTVNIYAGYAGNGIPDDISRFTVPARIARINVTGVRQRDFSANDVNVAAASIGCISWNMPDMSSSIQIAADSLNKISRKSRQDHGSIQYESASKLLDPEDSLQYEGLVVKIF